MLTQDLISDTSQFKLLLRVSGEGAHAVVYSPDADGSLINAPLSYGASASDDAAKALQEAVYDNPLLLSDFKDVTVVIEPRVVTPMPEVLSAETRREALGFLTDLTACDVLEDRTGLNGSVFVGAVGHDVLTFLRRTFPTATLTTHLGALSRYFASRLGQGNQPRMLAAFRPDAVDLIAVRGHRLLMANTFRFTDTADAVYYILASRRELGLDTEGCDLTLTGYRPHRDAVMPELRRFIERVLPLIFPPELFKAGKDALLAPFDLMISSLCV